MLRPKKAREFIKTTAEQLDVDILLADDIIQFFWENVRKALEEPKHCNVTVDNLGIFKVFPKKLVKLANSTDKFPDKNPDRQLRKIEYIKKLNHFLMEEENKKNCIKNKRDEV